MTEQEKEISRAKHRYLKWNLNNAIKQYLNFIFKKIYKPYSSGMKTFICSKCGTTYGWVLEYKDTGQCTYCVGEYEDGTSCKGGSR